MFSLFSQISGPYLTWITPYSSRHMQAASLILLECSWQVSGGPQTGGKALLSAPWSCPTFCEAGSLNLGFQSDAAPHLQSSSVLLLFRLEITTELWCDVSSLPSCLCHCRSLLLLNGLLLSIRI